MDQKKAKIIQKKMNAVNTTPPCVYPLVQDFCTELVPNVEPIFVEVRPVTGAQPNSCHANVPAHIAVVGGSMVEGWTIWSWNRLVLTAEFHACWRDPSTGELFDITPKREKRILFLPDSTRTYQGQRIPNVYKGVLRDPIVGEWIAAQAKLSSIVPVGPQKSSHALMQATLRSLRLTEQMLKLK